MRRAAVVLLLVVGAPLAAAAQVDYGPAVGVRVLGAGAASHAFGARFVAPSDAAYAVLEVSDNLGDRTALTACVDANRNGVCAAAEGDFTRSGVDTVTLAPPSGLAGGTPVLVAVYTFAADTDGVALGTTGRVTVRWG